MKKKITLITIITLVTFICCISLLGCSKEEVVDWPKAEYISDKAVYSGHGEVVFTDTVQASHFASREVTSIYVNEATEKDVIKYINQLSNAGFAYVPTFEGEEEPSGINENGYLLWRGYNEESNSGITITLFNDPHSVSEKNDSYQINYNLEIRFSNFEPV